MTKPPRSAELGSKTAPTGRSQGLRRLRPPAHRLQRLKKRFKPAGPKLPGAFRLFGSSVRLLAVHWELFVGIIAIYGLLNLILVQSIGANNLSDLKGMLDQLFTGHFAHLAASFSLFVYLLGSSGNAASPAAGGYQFILMLVVNLALIWALRQVYAKQPVRIRDSYYRGMTPLVPFVLVLGVIVLQLLPMIIGGTLFNTVMSSGIAAGGERFVWAFVFFCLSVLSLYLISSSLFALYVITLPDMTPLAALRAARKLVKGRRWLILRKIVFLPVVLLCAAALIMIPLILLVTPLAVWIFFVLTMIGIAVAQSYFYTLYKSLL